MLLVLSCAHKKALDPAVDEIYSYCNCPPPQYAVRVQISGLNGSVQLKLNDFTPVAIIQNGTFTFSPKLDDGSLYNITIVQQPAGQTCTLNPDRGILLGANAQVSLICSASVYTVGGSITGLTNSLVLTLNEVESKTISSNGTFVFNTPLPDGASYEIGILTQPLNQICAVTNRRGNIAGSNVTNVAISCSNLSSTMPRYTTPPQGADLSITYLQANVGNVDLTCATQAYSKLCFQDVEDRIQSNIAIHNPDIITLQEVFPDWLCREGKAAGNNQVCQNYQIRNVRDQVRRLLGTNYTVVCDPAHGWDCIAIKQSIGNFLPDSKGRLCPPSYLCGTTTFSNGDPTATNKDPKFAYFEATYSSSSYDGGFHMLYVDAIIHGRQIRIINGHPQSGGTGSGSKESARQIQIHDAFTNWTFQRTFLSCDCNLDPYREFSDISVVEWKQHVDAYDSSGNRISTNPFYYHSGVAETGYLWPPQLTAVYLAPLPSHTYDHVVSNFAYGNCQTLDGINRLDGGSGMDHKALLCTLYFF